MKNLYLISIFVATVASMVFAAPAYSGHMTPPWDEQISDPRRFDVLSKFSGAAVLDKETGLVWEQAPGTGVFNDDLRNWNEARAECAQKVVGGRRGWRLPSFFELASLTLSAPTAPALPPGHPFSNVQSFFYWAATTDADDSTVAWVVNTNGNVGPGNKVGRNFVWCVRGGHAGPDVY